MTPQQEMIDFGNTFDPGNSTANLDPCQAAKTNYLNLG